VPELQERSFLRSNSQGTVAFAEKTGKRWRCRENEVTVALVCPL